MFDNSETCSFSFSTCRYFRNLALDDQLEVDVAEVGQLPKDELKLFVEAPDALRRSICALVLRRATVGAVDMRVPCRAVTIRADSSLHFLKKYALILYAFILVQNPIIEHFSRFLLWGLQSLFQSNKTLLTYVYVLKTYSTAMLSCFKYK
jgi:hypothetical protein